MGFTLIIIAFTSSYTNATFYFTWLFSTTSGISSVKLHRQRHKLYLTQHWGNLLVTAAQETGGIRDALENNKKGRGQTGNNNNNK